MPIAANTNLAVEGDVTMTQEVIAPYLAVEDLTENLLVSAVDVTPTNYKFHYITCAGILQKGHFVKAPRGFSRIQVVRDTRLLNGTQAVRITHVAIQTQLAGRGELTVTEHRMTALGEDPGPPGSNFEPMKRLLFGSLLK
jgi:hypothetical protein